MRLGASVFVLGSVLAAACTASPGHAIAPTDASTPAPPPAASTVPAASAAPSASQVTAASPAAPSTDVAGSPPSAEALRGVEFVSASAVRSDGTEEPLLAGARVWLRFGDDPYEGVDYLDVAIDCNIYTGPWAIFDGRLEVEAVGGTEVPCDDRQHAQDELISGFVTADPTIALHGPDLTLRPRP
jgi:hypothetical protein